MTRPRRLYPPFAPVPPVIRDFEKIEGNIRLAAEIQKRWHDLGYTNVIVECQEVTVYVPRYILIDGHAIKVDGKQKQQSNEIVSNLISGLAPPPL